MAEDRWIAFRDAYFRMVRYDFALLKQHTRFVLALVAVLMVPMMYAAIYLSSMWDPASHTRGLKVAVVNSDVGMQFQGRQINLGKELLESLNKDPAFSYQVMQEAEGAKAAVREGAASFALLIPADFSQEALPGKQVGAGKLLVYTSEGNNFTGAGFARRFAPELARKMNQTLNEQRWQAVLQTASDTTQGLAQLREGVAKLQTGAAQLADATVQAETGARQLQQGGGKLSDGLHQLDGASVQLTEGMKKASAALHQMQAKMPAAADLQKLKAGAQQLSDGQKELGQGLRQLQQGAGQLRDGAQQLETGAGKLPFGRDKVVEAAQKLGQGAGQLHAGLGTALTGSDKLSTGAGQLNTGVAQLADGMGRLGNGIGQLTAALPPDGKLNAYAQGVKQADEGASQVAEGSKKLDAGLKQIAEGSGRLRDGLDLLASKLPAETPSLTGSATGLSESIQPEIVVVAPVANQGAGYTPNFAPLALWVGATLCTFLFAYRWLPRPLSGTPNLAVVLGKMLLPGLLVLGQTLVLAGVLIGVMHVGTLSIPRFLLTLLLTASAFMALIFMLVVILGDAGRLVALILLVLQLASAGATIPVELTSSFFQAVHPYLPLSWVVRALRIAMFGAFDGEWLPSVLVIVAFDAGCVLIAAAFARWRVVDEEDYQPLIEVD